MYTISQNEYGRFGGLKRFLIKNRQPSVIDMDIYLDENADDFFNFLIQEEIKAASGLPSFFTKREISDSSETPKY